VQNNFYCVVETALHLSHEHFQRKLSLLKFQNSKKFWILGEVVFRWCSQKWNLSVQESRWSNEYVLKTSGKAANVLKTAINLFRRTNQSLYFLWSTNQINLFSNFQQRLLICSSRDYIQPNPKHRTSRNKSKPSEKLLSDFHFYMALS